MKLSKYTSNFYESVADRADVASEAIFSIFFRAIKVASIKDIGCGNGIWLRQTLEIGSVKNRIGYDLPSALESAAPFSNKDIVFNEINLESKNYDFMSTDLALCLEVAEHVSSESAVRLIESICRSSKYVIFSAATPGQGGYNHINERSFNYWVSLFEANGFVGFDVFREKIQQDHRIPFFYRNNVFLFIELNVYKSTYTSLNDKFLNFEEMSSESEIKDYRSNLQLFSSFIISKLNFKLVNSLSIIKYRLNSSINKN
jgi:hypothetical protein